MRLSEPVNGHDTTTVYIQGTPTYSAGAPVTVVVDPHDPGYAELPGAPFTPNSQWETALVLGICFLVLLPSLVVTLALLRARRQRRVSRALIR